MDITAPLAMYQGTEFQRRLRETKRGIGIFQEQRESFRSQRPDLVEIWQREVSEARASRSEMERLTFQTLDVGHLV